MIFTSVWQVLMFMILVYVMVYAIVDRICKCVERYQALKDARKFVESKEVDFDALVKQFYEAQSKGSV